MSSQEASQRRLAKSQLNETDNDNKDATFTEERLRELRRKKYEFCRSELHLSKRQAREWADAAISTLLED